MNNNEEFEGEKRKMVEEKDYREGKTTILIDKVTSKRMRDVKLVPRETYDNVINRLLDEHEERKNNKEGSG